VLVLSGGSYEEKNFLYLTGDKPQFLCHLINRNRERIDKNMHIYFSILGVTVSLHNLIKETKDRILHHLFY
jgi:hypothetical protein